MRTIKGARIIQKLLHKAELNYNKCIDKVMRSYHSINDTLKVPKAQKWFEAVKEVCWNY